MKTFLRNQRRERGARWPFVFAAFVTTLLTLAGKGSAETPEERRADLLKGAAEALRKGRPVEAISKWRAAWDIRRAPEVACDIGTGEFIYGSPPAAAEFLSICEREYPASSPRDKKHKEEIQKNLREARQQAGALNIQVEETGATVTMDGRNIGRTPLVDTVFVEPGAHRIEVSLGGYHRQVVVMTVQKGEARVIPIKLTRIESMTKPAPIRPTPVPIPAPTSDGPNIPLAITGGALAIVSAAIGVGVTVAANDKADEARSFRTETTWRFQPGCDVGASGASISPCSNYLSEEEAGLLYARAAATAFAGAGLFTIATIAYVAFPRTFSKPTSPMSGAPLTVYQW